MSYAISTITASSDTSVVQTSPTTRQLSPKLQQIRANHQQQQPLSRYGGRITTLGQNVEQQIGSTSASAANRKPYASNELTNAAAGAAAGGGFNWGGAKNYTTTNKQHSPSLSRSSKDITNNDVKLNNSMHFARAVSGIPAPPSCSPRQRLHANLTASGDSPSRQTVASSQQQQPQQQHQTIGSNQSSERMYQTQQPTQLTPKHIQAAPRLSKALPRLTSTYLQQQQQQQQPKQSPNHHQSNVIDSSSNGPTMGARCRTSAEQVSDSQYAGKPIEFIDRVPTFTTGGNYLAAELSPDQDRCMMYNQTRTKLPLFNQRQPTQQQQQSAQVTNKQHLDHHHHHHPHSHHSEQPLSYNNNNKSCSPRTSVTTSKIPHQVNGNETPESRCYLQRQSTTESCAATDIDESIVLKNKYLTFSKDQATSHFKSLREELNGQLVSPPQVSRQIGPQVDEVDLSKGLGVCMVKSPRVEEVIESLQNKASPKPRPRPTLDKLNKIKQQQQTQELVVIEHENSGKYVDSNNIRCNSSDSFLTGDDNNELKTQSATNINNIRQHHQQQTYQQQQQHHHQQPVCEAFIMTGQSMLKLSCSESSNDNNNTNNNKSKNYSHSNVISRSDNAATIPTTTNNINNICMQGNNSTDNLKQPTSEVDSRTIDCQRGKSVSLSKLNGSNGFNNNNNNNNSGGDNNNTVGQLASQAVNLHPEPEASIEGRVNDNKGPQEPQPQPPPQSAAQHQMGNQMHEQQQRQPQQQREHEREKQQQHSGGIILPSEGQNYSQKSHQIEGNNAYQTTSLMENSSIRSPPIKSTPKLDQQQSPKPPMQLEQNQQQQLEPDGASMAPQHQQQQQQQQQQPKDNTCHDRESARRLAKRLYNLSGFKRSDVSHHLAKNNPFSQMVAEEYLNLFDFRSMKLDAALRKFLSKLQLNGETQERERILGQFSQRYYDCNKDKFPNAETVQTLVCALILLNTDLHGNMHEKKRKNKRPRLGLGAFIDGLNSSLTSLPTQCGGNGQTANLASQISLGSMNNNKATTTSTTAGAGQPNHATTNTYTFPRHLLVDLYESIKKRPIKYVEDKSDMATFEAELDRLYNQHQQAGNGRSNTLPSRRHSAGSNAASSTLSANSRRQLKHGLSKVNGAQSDDGESVIEFKSGFLSRKRTFDAQGKPTGKGRRGWRRAFVILQDLRLVMRYGQQKALDAFDQKSSDGQQGDQTAKAQAQLFAQDLKNMIRIHHTFAKRSTSYTKREHVFHLRLADQSEYLLQANSETEMNLWVDTINFASACLSSPALPNAISNSKRFQLSRNQRPILPSSYTKLSYWEQLIDHEERLQRLKVELEEHLNEATATRNANKRDKTEFIEKIAYLKQEIERYTVYVDLMRKKSNSPEAIILSKHPQIASMTPSDELVKCLPSFVPPKLAEGLDNETSDSETQKQ